MKKVSEKEFVKFIKSYKGELKVSMIMSADPPMVIYTDADTNEVIGRYPEVSLGIVTTYKDVFYEIKE